jgi:beta-galactosidase
VHPARAETPSWPPALRPIAFGGDYNPEQWPEPVWTDDYRLFDEARIDTVTLGVFDWALLQPGPGQYDFTLLDRIVDRAQEQGRSICLATATAATRRGWRRPIPR